MAEAENIRIIAQYVEVETDKGADALDGRPQLAAALASAKTAKCCVLVSNLNRLSRDVAFVAGLMAQRGLRPPNEIFVYDTKDGHPIFHLDKAYSPNAAPSQIWREWMELSAVIDKRD